MAGWRSGAVALGLLLGTSCSSTSSTSPETGTDRTVPATITLTSSAFGGGDEIPEVFSCEGENRSPPLAWSGVPGEATELALVVEDPDAPGGTFVHWVLTNLEPGLPGLQTDEIPPGATQGQASSEKTGYIGPCPPDGQRHRYVFTLYALGRRLDLPEGAGPSRALPAIRSAAVARGELVARFGR